MPSACSVRPAKLFCAFACCGRKPTLKRSLPIAWTSEYVDRSLQKVVTEAPRRPEKLMIELIGEIYGKKCTEVRQVIEASSLPPEAAVRLREKNGVIAELD